MGIIKGLGLFPTFLTTLSNQMFTVTDHAPWHAQHFELTEINSKSFQLKIYKNKNKIVRRNIC